MCRSGQQFDAYRKITVPEPGSEGLQASVDGSSEKRVLAKQFNDAFIVMCTDTR